MASGRVSCGVEAIGRLASVRYRWFVCVPIRCWQEVRRVEGDSRTCSDRAIWYNSCSGWISVYRLVGPVPFGYAVALVRLSPQTRRPAHVGVVCYVSSVTSFCGGEGAVMPNIIPSVFGRLCIGYVLVVVVVVWCMARAAVWRSCDIPVNLCTLYSAFLRSQPGANNATQRRQRSITRGTCRVTGVGDQTGDLAILHQ